MSARHQPSPTRRGYGRNYVPTHTHLPPLGRHLLRSCGKCGRHVVNKGGTKHRVFGWIGECCARTGASA